jgi:hypothetical protein
MDDESRFATKLLDALARSNTKLGLLWQEIRGHSSVKNGSQQLEVREYCGVGAIEGYVDVELRSGKAICWWMEAEWSGNLWTLSASVHINDEQGQYDLLVFPRLETGSFDEFIAALDEMADELKRSARSIDLGQDPPALV